jgi:ATP-dependent helicase/nuclease subunit B
MFQGVTILAGAARSGKTERLLVAYRQVLGDGPLGGALWISPTHRAAAEIRRRILAGPLLGCFNPHCLTFEQFAARVLDSSPLDIRPIAQPLVRVLLKRLVNDSRARGELRYFEPIAESGGFLDLLAGFIREFKRLEIWPEELAKACGLRRSQKDNELLRIYEAYQRLLNDRHLYDTQGQFWSARALLREGQLAPFQRLRHVFVDGFTDFTRTEHEMLQILAGRVDSLTISLPLEEGARRPQLFSKSTKTATELQLRHRAIKIERLARRPMARPALAHLEENLFVNPRHLDAAPEAQGIEVLPAAGATDEIELLSRRIKRLLVHGDDERPGRPVPPEEILVVFRSLSDTADLVQEVFDQFGIPLAIGRRPPLGRSPIMAALVAWLRLDLEDWPFRQVLRLLGHNFFRPEWPEWKAGKGPSAAERLTYALRIPSGRAELLAAVERVAASSIADAVSSERQGASLAEQARLSLPLLTRMARVLDALPERATFTQWSTALDALADATGMLGPAESTDHPSPDSSRAAWAQLTAALQARDYLAGWLGEAPPVVSRREFFDHLQEILKDESAPSDHDETGRVRLVSAENARNLSAPYVFAAGLSEKAFPPPHREDCIHSEAETRELISAGLPLVPHADRRSYEMLLFYEVVTRATKRLVLSYPALDQAGLPLSPSPFVTELENAFAPLRQSGQGPQLSSVPASNDVLSQRDFRVRAVSQALSGENGMLAELMRHPVTSVAAESIVAGLRTSWSRRQGDSFGPFEGMFQSAAARQLLTTRFGPERCWSASQLEQYARCPHQFFLQRVLGLRPLDEPALEIDYSGRGDMLHWILWEAHRRLNERSGGPTSPATVAAEEFLAASRELLDELMDTLQGERALANGLLEIDARHVAAWLARYHDQHNAYDKHWQGMPIPLRPAHFEVEFGPPRRGGEPWPNQSGEGNRDPLSRPEPFELVCGSETIRFSGRIDRIDLGQAGEQTVFNIVDYKSGRPSPRTSARSIDEGYSLQLPLYALVARELLSEKQAMSYRAAYWHVAANGYQEKDAVKFQLDAAGQIQLNPERESLEARLRLRVRSLVAGIRLGEFPMYSADEKCTSHCDFATVCRVNQARQRHKTWHAPEVESP